jgi:RimJ/RimL family protein N-acetyltransferase
MTPVVREEVVLPSGQLATITSVVEADAAAVLDHLEQLGSETDFLTFGSGELGLTLDQQTAYIAGLQDGAGGFMIKAQVAGQIVAFATIRRTPRPRIAHVGEFGLAVARDHWGHGIGKALCQIVIAQAARIGVTRIELRVRADNRRARRLYESVGFVVHGRAERGFRVGDDYFDELLMSLILP